MFNDKQIAKLQAPLDRAKVKSRKQGKSRVSYIEGWQAQETANEIFGFHAWDSIVVDLRMTCEQDAEIGERKEPGHHVAYMATVRVTVTTPDGSKVVRDGVGSGDSKAKDLVACHEGAAKEAQTDAEKRALKSFGNQFGLALYDKEQRNVADIAAWKAWAGGFIASLSGKSRAEIERMATDKNIAALRIDHPESFERVSAAISAARAAAETQVEPPQRLKEKRRAATAKTKPEPEPDPEPADEAPRASDADRIWAKNFAKIAASDLESCETTGDLDEFLDDHNDNLERLAGVDDAAAQKIAAAMVAKSAALTEEAA